MKWHMGRIRACMDIIAATHHYFYQLTESAESSGNTCLGLHQHWPRRKSLFLWGGRYAHSTTVGKAEPFPLQTHFLYARRVLGFVFFPALGKCSNIPRAVSWVGQLGWPPWASQLGSHHGVLYLISCLPMSLLQANTLVINDFRTNDGS